MAVSGCGELDPRRWRPILTQDQTDHSPALAFTANQIFRIGFLEWISCSKLVVQQGADVLVQRLHPENPCFPPDIVRSGH